MQGAEEGRALDPASATSSDASFDVAEPRPPDGFRWIRRDPMLVVEVGLVVLLVVLAWRLQWIADDGYIYLTHVQNWVENGAGPNLNVGERVEGYTSVGWFVLLSIGDLLRPHGLLSLEQLTILVGLVLTAAAAVCWIGIERTAIATTETTVGPDEADRAPRSRTVANLPLVLFVTSYVVRSYATSGLETPLIMLWATAAVWVIWARRRPLVVAALLAGVGPLVRPELALVSVVLVAIVILEIRARRGTDPVGSRTIAALVALVVLPAVVSEVVRIAYYGQLLPNTYYVKTGTSHGWADGWRYLVDAAGPHRWWWILAVSAVLATCVPIARWWRGRSATSTTLVVTAADCRRWLLLGSAVALALAAMRNGGDFMHGRTLLPAFVTLLGSLSGAASVALDRVRQQPARLVG
ncbi:MAG: hypothetical protein KDB37_21485, partial [Ilumatobacter sp.]|nr:hypothetical protein [Ilumatobacter sp.]